MVYCMLHVERLNTTNRFLQCAETELGKIFAHLFSDVFEKVDYELGLTTEPLTQFWVLCCDANRASIQVADAHHDATAHH